MSQKREEHDFFFFFSPRGTSGERTGERGCRWMNKITSSPRHGPVRERSDVVFLSSVESLHFRAVFGTAENPTSNPKHRARSEATRDWQWNVRRWTFFGCSIPAAPSGVAASFGRGERR